LRSHPRRHPSFEKLSGRGLMRKRFVLCSVEAKRVVILMVGEDDDGGGADEDATVLRGCVPVQINFMLV
jgi:hypothetical protein